MRARHAVSLCWVFGLLAAGPLAQPATVGKSGRSMKPPSRPVWLLRGLWAALAIVAAPAYAQALEGRSGPVQVVGRRKGAIFPDLVRAGGADHHLVVGEIELQGRAPGIKQRVVVDAGFREDAAQRCFIRRILQRGTPRPISGSHLAMRPGST